MPGNRYRVPFDLTHHVGFHPAKFPRTPSITAVRHWSHNSLTWYYGSSGYVVILVGRSLHACGPPLLWPIDRLSVLLVVPRIEGPDFCPVPESGALRERLLPERNRCGNDLLSWN